MVPSRSRFAHFSARGAAAAVALALTVTPAAGSLPTRPALAVTQDRAILLDPDDAAWQEQAPERFRVRFTTGKGDFVVDVQRDWAPIGADRFYNLVRHGFYDDTRVYRIREGVFAQFGLSGDPAVNAVWYERTIPDDPPGQRHTRGRVFFAMRGPDDRTTQVVINLRDNPDYYEQGFVPFGEVIAGMDVVDSLYSGYGESAGGGMRGGNQGRIVSEGNAHLDADFPLLDRIIRAVIE
jgi:cyclophilin family peptidyl-prolyl cis-trans isomerase